MEFPKRERAFLQGSPRRSTKATRPGATTGSDENARPNHLVPVMAASPQRKKVLGERNAGGVGALEGTASLPLQQPKPAPSPPTLAGRGAGPYDPKTNYTTPRPAFLRYDPEWRREILLRVSRAAEVIHDDCSSTTSGTAASEEDGDFLSSDAAAALPISSALKSDSEAELDDSEEEDEVVPARRGRCARRLFLLLICVSCCFCYMYCANPSSFSTYSSEDAFDLGTEGDALDLGAFNLGIEEDAFDLGTEIGGVDGNRASLRNLNLVAVTVMGLADICLNVSSGELTCQIGSEKSEDVPNLREDSEIDNTEVAISFQNDKRSSEVHCLGGNVPLDSVGSTSTHTDNMEEGSSESVNLEEEISSASYKMKDRKGIESEELDLWQYENTAEAAKTIFSTVKFMWSTMEPHLLQILACLSFAGLVAALYRYYQRSRERCNCIITCGSLAEEPLLVPNQVVQLSETSSAQDAQLPVHSSEHPMQLTIRKQGLPDSLEVPMELKMSKLGPLVSIEDPVQESLPKTDPLVTLKVPVIGHGIHGQKLKQGDPENMLTSNGRFLNHSDADCSKPPEVELLGEFIFENSSRGRSIKSLNQNAGDATVQELLEHLGKDEDVDKMQVHSSIIKSPSVRRAKEEQKKSAKGKKTDTTATPLTPTTLRRSSRLRNKVTSP